LPIMVGNASCQMRGRAAKTLAGAGELVVVKEWLGESLRRRAMVAERQSLGL
jgi:hypothetical protein